MSRFQRFKSAIAARCCCGGAGGSEGRQFDAVVCINSCRRCLLPGDRQFQNVILLSVSFMLIFTAFQTLTNIEETVLKSVASQDKSFTGDGFISLAIIYTVFAISNWFAPPIVAIINSKWTMVIGSVFYVLFIASFLYPKTWLLYTMSALIGVGGALLWTAQGNYLTLSSTPETMSRHSSVFWAIFQCSMFFGNGFVFWQFEGKEQIDKPTQILVFATLTTIACLGILSLLFLRPPGIQNPIPATPQMRDPSQYDISEDQEENPSYTSSVPAEELTSDQSAIVAIKNTIRLTKNRDILCLSFLFIYTGFELSFQSGVYSAAVGATSAFGYEAKRLVGVCGIMVGAGEVAGGATFGIFGHTVKKGRDPIVLLGFICHTLAFYLIFLNLPNDSPLPAILHPSDFTYIDSSTWIVMLCAFLLGFGDACFQTQIYSIIGALFPKNSSPAFAWFKFTQSSAAAISFFYSTQATLAIQLILLEIFCLVGVLTFFIVEWKLTRDRIDEENQRLIDNFEEDQENYG